MKRKHALILAFLLTGLIVSTYSLFQLTSKSENLETVLVSRVIDGDTLVLDDGRKIRLLNINAPEKSFPTHKISTNYLKKYENRSVSIQITDRDKYNRLLARLYTPDYLNLALVSQGLASKFLVSSKEKKQFSNAERNAISQGIGVWQHSTHYGCFTSQIDKNLEFVILENSCDEINLKDWKLKDESTKTFTFPSLKIENKQEITLHSNEGQNTKAELFWQQKTNVWNNDRDSLYLFDSNGLIVHYNSYGY
tara:strand:- start:223 stop:975 length:753 start_codon:yes stop_codon:yes gene_type:complete